MELIGGKGYLREGTYVVYFEKEDNAKVGRLIDLEDEIIGYLEEGGNIEGIQISPFEPIKGAELAAKRSIETSMMDDTYSTENESYEVIEVETGRVICDKAYEDEALDELVDLISSGIYTAEELSLTHKVDYSCLYDITEKTEIVFNFPDRQVDVDDWSQESNLDIQKEIGRLFSILDSRKYSI